MNARRLAAAIALLCILAAALFLSARGPVPAPVSRPHVSITTKGGRSQLFLASLFTPVVGGTVASTPGNWGNSPTSFTYQWSQCDSGGANCAIIGAATSSSYVVQSSDAGHTLIVAVTATNANGSATQTSAASGLVPGGGGGGGGNGTLLFDGTFGSGVLGAKWPQVNTSPPCWTVNSTTVVQIDLTSSCTQGGVVRTDICSSTNCDYNQGAGDVYTAGQSTCTTIPVDFPTLLPGVPSADHLQFAEAKDWEASLYGWGFFINSYRNGNTRSDPNQFALAFGGLNGGVFAWWSNTNVTTGWHTLSICTNNAKDNTGVVNSIWLDGVRQTFNTGACNGLQTCSGFPIITDGVANWPLLINDYTTGYPVPNQVLHGDPLIATIGSNGLPPMPAGGWNSP